MIIVISMMQCYDSLWLRVSSVTNCQPCYQRINSVTVQNYNNYPESDKFSELVTGLDHMHYFVYCTISVVNVFICQ